MKNIRRWLGFLFSASDKEVRGILVLSVILLILVLTRFWLSTREPRGDIRISQRIIENAAKVVDRKVKKRKEKNFNPPARSIDPNRSSVMDWISFGLDTVLAQRIQRFLSKGGSFDQTSDLKKIYGMPLWFYDSIEPYLIISKSRKIVQEPSRPNKKEASTVRSRPTVAVVGLNAADSSQLTKIKGIGPVRARGIIKYREILGGFFQKTQLLEVYGIDSTVYRSVKDQVIVDTGLHPVERIAINQADFKTLLRHPYLSYEQVKALMNFKTQHKMIRKPDFMRFPFLTEAQKAKLIPYLRFRLSAS